MLTGCRVDGRVLARVCVVSFRTRQAHIDACVEDVAAATAELATSLAQQDCGPGDLTPTISK
jgi:hypothetical protein